MSKTKGMFWHVHHDQLLEYCYGYGERVRYIKKNKPKDERELRLRLFQLVKGKLPVAVIKAQTACDKAQIAYDKARTAYDKAWTAYDKARTAYDKAWTAYDKAWTACDKAQIAYDKAQIAYDKAQTAYDKALQNNVVAIEKLHRKECPDCPWDGKTIFRKGEK